MVSRSFRFVDGLLPVFQIKLGYVRRRFTCLMNPEDQVFGLGPTLDDSIEYRKAARQPPFRRRRAAVVCVCRLTQSPQGAKQAIFNG